MRSTDLQQIFLESASEVLETMFFTGVVDDSAEQESVRVVSAELTFHGNPSGRFGVQVPYKTGRTIAASFMGADECDVSEAQINEVICELSNMICGSVLSRIEAGARFELLHPEIDEHNADWHHIPHAVGYTFGLEDGTMTLWIQEAKPSLVCPAA
jgi:chemotaxis protein CheY-P-specific phosphatase CheC